MIYLLSALRSILATPIIIISIIIYGTISFIFCTVFKGVRFFPTFFTVSWCRFVTWVIGIKVIVEGRENLPQSSCMIVFNHTSLLDIPIINSQLTNHIRFGAKDSLFKIPIFGQAAASFGTIRILRGDRQKVIEQYNKTLPIVKKKNMSIILAAEGTRNPNPPQLMDFKSGPFILAIDGQMPVVPVMVFDVYKLLPKHTYFTTFGQWRKTVRLKILKPISTDGLKFEDRTQVKNEAFKVMSQEISDNS